MIIRTELLRFFGKLTTDEQIAKQKLIVDAEKFGQAFAVDKAGFMVKGIMIGVIIGLVVSVFRLTIDYTLTGLFKLYPYLRDHPHYIPLYVVATLIGGVILVQIIKPLYTKSKEEITWFSSLWRTVAGALLALCPGISAGREGPCIQIGGFVAQGFCENIFSENEKNKMVLVHSGMAAGLGAAFSAPIAGTLFLLEAISFNFSPIILFTSMTATISSVMVTYFFFGITPCLYVPHGASLPLDQYWVLLLLGVLIGGMSRVYQWSLLTMRKGYNLAPKLKNWNIFLPLLLVIPIGLVDPHVLGGSHDLILEVASQRFLNVILNYPFYTMLGVLFLLTVVRFVFTIISCDATAPTGIFMPILVLGALFGAIYASILIKFGILQHQYYLNIVICAMAAYFGASLKTPFTGVILLIETVGDVKYIMPVLIVTWIATIINTWLKGKSVYA
ncbi:ClC family H(+)/Cl(-) exchange transporter [Actinobacillus delphinicola]|uniref:Chloride channel protein n=1 Tax=Actinobacillus delphinicola TaxID=51161 RepID=A0A448TV71_9PAST|nr:ClC family H(+)/Cl(-) exchange transporter [Actinobacillus delphinicola]VEJ09820.1 chloride channel protein [Actinobacillus delphinicola]